jgi:ABC-type Fe3+-hydroxamate transport system substrate-binding protein
MNLASDEILADILDPSRLVAVTALVDETGHLERGGTHPAKSIARFPKVDIERLIALKPDLVVVSEYTDADVLRALQTFGPARSSHDRPRLAPRIPQARCSISGEAVGETAKAEAGPGLRCASRRDRHAPQGGPRPKVLYWASGFTAGSRTAFDATDRLRRRDQRAAALKGISGITPIGAERAYGVDPDWLFIGRETTTSREIREHPLLSRMRAVKAGHVVEMPTELLVALNHHAVKSCEFMARSLHRERFR